MVTILSPAKNMQNSTIAELKVTKPRYAKKTKELLDVLKQCNPWQLESKLHINQNLAMKAFTDFQNFSFDTEGTPALLAYHGLQYQYLQANDFTFDDFEFADSHIRIISALYGILNPMDGILPYRLEMQCKIEFDGKNLYQFWKDSLYHDLKKENHTIINLASSEYSRAIIPYLVPEDSFITCNFVVNRNGKMRMLATDAKMARGQLSRYIIKNRIDEPEGLKDFYWKGYEFSEELSDYSKYTFTKQW